MKEFFSQLTNFGELKSLFRTTFPEIIELGQNAKHMIKLKSKITFHFILIL